MNKSQIVRSPFAEPHLWLPKDFCRFRYLSSPCHTYTEVARMLNQQSISGFVEKVHRYVYSRY